VATHWLARLAAMLIIQFAVLMASMRGGAMLHMLDMTLLLGSWPRPAALPVIIGFLASPIFTAEHPLREGIAGYTDYAARVRYRLLPRLW
jgi:protein-S-isoprenylcysteine O-methyltransferase Ste14